MVVVLIYISTTELNWSDQQSLRFLTSSDQNFLEDLNGVVSEEKQQLQRLNVCML